jgi:twitching motility two-component system response regulator PilG
MVSTISTTKTSDDSSKKGVVSTQQLLQLLRSQITGKLTVYPAGVDAIPWRIYVSNGQIHYATSSLGQRERAGYFLKMMTTSEISQKASGNWDSDYTLLCQIWRSGVLPFQSLRQLVLSMTQEALIHALKVPEVEMTFEKGLDLDPILLSVPVQDLVASISAPLVQWAGLFKTRISPFSRVTVKNLSMVQQAIAQQSTKAITYQRLETLLTPKYCLYEVASHLGVDTLGLGTFLQPLENAGAITIGSFASTQKRPLIACIDDSKTVQRNVRLILEAAGYQAIELMDPTRALTTLVRQKPSLILLDISMPGIDGYELCRMLRSTAFLKETPIIMLTGRDGVVDRLRARMVGANDYLTKPCEANQMLALIQKHLQVETIR